MITERLASDPEVLEEANKLARQAGKPRPDQSDIDTVIQQSLPYLTDKYEASIHAAAADTRDKIDLEREKAKARGEAGTEAFRERKQWEWENTPEWKKSQGGNKPEKPGVADKRRNDLVNSYFKQGLLDAGISNMQGVYVDQDNKQVDISTVQGIMNQAREKAEQDIPRPPGQAAPKGKSGAAAEKPAEPGSTEKLQVGQKRTFKGRVYTVTAINPDGSVSLEDEDGNPVIAR